MSGIRAPGHKKSPTRFGLVGLKDFRQRPTLPQGGPCSTIGAAELDDRVRDGIGYGLCAVATGKPYRRRQLLCERYVISNDERLARSVTMPGPDARAPNPSLDRKDMDKPHGRLVLVSFGLTAFTHPAYQRRGLRLPFRGLLPGHLISRGASRLDAFSGYPVRT